MIRPMIDCDVPLAAPPVRELRDHLPPVWSDYVTESAVRSLEPGYVAPGSLPREPRLAEDARRVARAPDRGPGQPDAGVPVPAHESDRRGSVRPRPRAQGRPPRVRGHVAALAAVAAGQELARHSAGGALGRPAALEARPRAGAADRAAVRRPAGRARGGPRPARDVPPPPLRGRRGTHPRPRRV